MHVLVHALHHVKIVMKAVIWLVSHQASLSWQTVVAVELRFHWGQCVLQSLGPVLQGAAQLPCGVTLYP